MLAPRPHVHHLSQLTRASACCRGKQASDLHSACGRYTYEILTELMECLGLREGLVGLPVSLGRMTGQHPGVSEHRRLLRSLSHVTSLQLCQRALRWVL